MISKISPHIRRIRNQMGASVWFGKHQFREHGYFPCRMETEVDRHEGFLTHIIQDLLAARTGTFIDVGANIGQTFAKVLNAERDRPYLGFEPQLTCCFNIEQFIRLNCLYNARIVPIALSDSNCALPFYSMSETDDLASLVNLNGQPKYKSVVQVRIGDEVLEEAGVRDICAIKVDVQGTELQVLHGLTRTLRKKRPPVIFEMLPNFSGVNKRVMHALEECEKNQMLADSLFEFFRDAGYEIFALNEKTGEKVKINCFELNDIANFIGRNYIAFPNRLSDNLNPQQF